MRLEKWNDGDDDDDDVDDDNNLSTIVSVEYVISLGLWPVAIKAEFQHPGLSDKYNFPVGLEVYVTLILR
jgi:hypothetical protein